MLLKEDLAETGSDADRFATEIVNAENEFLESPLLKDQVDKIAIINSLVNNTNPEHILTDAELAALDLTPKDEIAYKELRTLLKAISSHKDEGDIQKIVDSLEQPLEIISPEQDEQRVTDELKRIRETIKESIKDERRQELEELWNEKLVPLYEKYLEAYSLSAKDPLRPSLSDWLKGKVGQDSNLSNAASWVNTDKSKSSQIIQKYFTVEVFNQKIKLIEKRNNAEIEKLLENKK